jgi:ABC-2 type transport system ATP-binding protein
VIGLRGVHKRFAERVVLNGIDMQVGRGEIYGLLGPNGCGKSTTINLICGRLRADAGEISVDGRRQAAGARWLGVVAQDAALYPQLSCRQNLDFFASVYGLDRANRRRRIAEVLDEFELQPFAEHPAGQLSGGWRRRLHCALAVVHSPKLLILDEPSASLDLAARQGLGQILRRQRAAGTTVLLTTHHLDEAEQLCDRIGVLQQGSLVAEGRPEEIRQRVPAEQIALLDAEDLAPLRARAMALGLQARDIGGRLGVLLPAAQSIADCVRRFEGLDLRSLALSPVTLEHAYLQLLEVPG